MEDTSPEIKKAYYQIIMSKSEEDRFIMCADMFETGRQLVLSQMPLHFSLQDQKRYIYERTYGEPLPEDFFDRKK